MPKGNPNPSPATRFKPGNEFGGGKTKEQRRLEVEAAVMAVKLRHAALFRMTEKVSSGETDAADVINSDLLRLFKDSEDRAHGTPKQAVEHTGENGGALQIVIQRFAD